MVIGITFRAIIFDIFSFLAANGECLILRMFGPFILKYK